MSKVRDGYVRPVDFRHGRVDMTHGSGGRAMAQLIDELFLREFDNPWLRQRNDQALLRGAGRPAGGGDRQPRRLAALLSGRRHRLPVGPRDAQRRRDGGRAAAVPRRVVHPRGGLSARGPEAHRRVDGARRARGRRADRHRRHQGRRARQGRRRVHHHHRHRRRAAGRGRLRRPRAARRCDPRQRHARRPRRRDHVAAREPLVRDDDRVGHRRAARAGRGDDRGGARTSAACAIRPAAGSRRR